MYRAAFFRLLLVTALWAMSCTAAAPVSFYKIVAKYPHSIQSYTEGFFYLDGLFYEGTGLNGRSSLIVSQPETGKQLQHIDLLPQYFGEGIVAWGQTYMSGHGSHKWASSMIGLAFAS
jgi:glutamine cyclotransferase